MIISKETSRTLMAANLIATILVVAIHYDSRPMDGTASMYKFDYLFQDFLINGVARSAVPFFACVSGFFAAIKLAEINGYHTIIKSKIKSLLLPYLIASILILFGSELFIAIREMSVDKTHFRIYRLLHDVVIHPGSTQFWYLRDMFLLVILCPVLLIRNKFVSSLIGITLAYLWLRDLQPFPVVGGWYLINTEPLFYFWLGGMVFNCQLIESALRVVDNLKYVLIFSWFSLLVFRTAFYPGLNAWYASDYNNISISVYKIAIAIGVIMIIQLAFLVSKNKIVTYLSGYTFFVYLFHLAPLSFFKLITVDNSSSFFWNFPIALVLVFIIAYVVSRYFEFSYSLLTGGRTAKIAVARIS